METTEIIALISALSSIAYATILLWDRISDKPKLNIEEIKFEEFRKGQHHVSIKVVNRGKREAINCIGRLSVKGSTGEKMDLINFWNKKKKTIEMYWFPYEGWVSKKIKGKIGHDKVELEFPLHIMECRHAILGIGDWNRLQLTLPGFGYTSAFKELKAGEYKLLIEVSSGTSKVSKEVKFHHPEYFEQTRIIHFN